MKQWTKKTNGDLACGCRSGIGEVKGQLGLELPRGKEGWHKGLVPGLDLEDGGAACGRGIGT